MKLVAHIYYEVEKDDTLSEIAEKFGMSFDSLVNMNREFFIIRDPNLILPGEMLLIQKRLFDLS